MSLLKRSAYILSIFVISFSLLSFLASPALSESVNDLEGQLGQKEGEIKGNEAAIESLKDDIASIHESSLGLDEKIKLIEETLADVDRLVTLWSRALDLKLEQVNEKEGVLDLKQAELDTVSSNLYKKSRVGWIDLLLSFEFSEFMQGILVKRFVAFSYLEDVKLLHDEYAQLGKERKLLQEEYTELEAQKGELEVSQSEVLAEKAEAQRQIAAKNSYASQLSGQISLLKDEISELQAAILLAKSGGAYTSAGDVPATGDVYATLSGFQSNAPSGSFGVFSFGAYTHRNGMSQYGALARAENGQNYAQILNSYYGKSPVSKGTNGNINVNGVGAMDFETSYLYGISEMPSHWPVEALKAQAVAARTYAYSYFSSGSSICATESCQVWTQSKSSNPPAAWKQAVDETKGKVLDGVTTYYSATSGGYINGVGWDTTDGQGGGSGWAGNAWESIAGSPWFYKSWYKLGYSDSASSCGRYPWMNNEEMADILNTWLVLNNNGVSGSVDSSRILPITINSCGFSGVSGNPYSMGDMRDLLSNPVTTVSGSPVTQNNGAGSSTNILFATNRGTLSVPASEFKETYNTRAPGYLSIPQFGFTHIDIQRK